MFRVLIVEDDSLACQLLMAHLSRRTDTTLVGTASTYDEAERRLAVADYDLVFFDVQLFHRSTFDLVPLVAKGARIIFLTDSDRHALRAFELNALDYIIKPISSARLAAAMDRAHEGRRAPQTLPRLQRTDQVFLRGATGGGMFVALHTIALVRSSENYSEVVLSSGNYTIVRRTMQAWETILPEETFVRVHRTAIINLECVERIVREPDKITQLALRGVSKTVPVSRREWGGVRTRLAAISSRPIQRH